MSGSNGRGRPSNGAPKKTARKAVRKPVPPGLKPFVPGDPRINRTKPGPGRPRNQLRDLFAKAVEDRIEVLCQIVDNGFKDSDRIAAFNALAKLSGIELTKIVGDEEASPVQQVLNLGDGCEIVF